MMTKPLYLVILINLILLAQTGCLERKEKITVTPDGRTTMQLSFRGDPDEFEINDAMPDESNGWTVDRTRKLNDEGKEESTWTASQDFAPFEDLPRTYAKPNDPDTDLYLDFPTTIKIDRRKDYTYYYFTRTYTPRKWAYMQHWKDLFFDDSVKELSEKPVEELSRIERVQLVQAIIGVEAFKQIEFTRAAINECAPDLDPVHTLTARQALLNAYQKVQLLDESVKSNPDLNVPTESSQNHTPLDIIVDHCGSMLQLQQVNCFDEQATRITENGYNAIVQSLTQQAEFDVAQLQAFETSYQRAKKYHAVSERLGGHHFEICVDLPGTIVAHNSDNIERKEGEACWEIDGDSFRDRPVELQLVTRLQHGRKSD